MYYATGWRGGKMHKGKNKESNDYNMKRTWRESIKKRLALVWHYTKQKYRDKAMKKE